VCLTISFDFLVIFFFLSSLDLRQLCYCTQLRVSLCKAVNLNGRIVIAIIKFPGTSRCSSIEGQPRADCTACMLSLAETLAGPLLSEVPVIKDIINSACRPDARERRLIHTCAHVPCRVRGTYPTTTTRTTTTTKTTTVGNHNECIVGFALSWNPPTRFVPSRICDVYRSFHVIEFIIEATTFHRN